MPSVIRNSFVYGIGKAIPCAAAIILLPIYTRFLTVSEYGIIAAIGMITTFVHIFFTFAIDRSIFRLYWDFKTNEERRRYLGSITIGLYALVFLFSVLIFFPFQNTIQQVFPDIPFAPYYILGILSQICHVLQVVPKTYLQIHHKAIKFVIVTLIEFILTTALTIWFVVYRQEQAFGFLKALMLGPLIMVPGFVTLNLKIISLRFNLCNFQQSLRYGLPMIPILLGSWSLNAIDRLFLDRFYSLSEVGIYSLGYRIAGLLLVVTGALHQAYTPFFFQTASKTDQHGAKQQLEKYNLFFFSIVYCITFSFTILSRDAVVLLLDPRFHAAANVIPVISLAYFVNYCSGFFHLCIYQHKRTELVMLVQMGAAVINIALNYLLIPLWGVMGAAWATLLSFLIAFQVKNVFAQWCYYVKFPVVAMYAGMIIVIISIAVFDFFDFPIFISIFSKLILSLTIILTIILRMNQNRRKLRTFFHKSNVVT